MCNKSIKIFIISLAFFSKIVLFSDQFILDQYFSPYSSSSSILYLEDQLLSLQARYKDDKYNAFVNRDPKDYFNPKYYYLNGPYYLSNGWPERISRATLRFLELNCVWYPLNFMTEIVQHEVFGHGYRIRELGSKKIQLMGYTIQFKIDRKGFGLKKASTSYRLNHEQLTPTEDLLLGIGGCEAASILAHNVLMSWLEKGQIDGRQASLWQLSHFELPHYIATLNKLRGLDLFFVSRGHDIASYLIDLNLLYPSYVSLDSQLADLRLKSSFSILLSPFTYLTLYSQAAYILFNSSITIPGFHNDVFYFLPGYKLGLSPYGLENIIEFYCWSDKMAPTYLYLKGGNFSENDYFGMGIENRGIFRTKFGTFGLKTDLWIQPKAPMRSFSTDTKIDVWTNYFYNEFYLVSTESGFSKNDLFTKTFGAAFSIIYRYTLKKSFLNNTWIQLGYKSKGFLPGEPLRQSPIIKLGLKLVY